MLPSPPAKAETVTAAIPTSARPVAAAVNPMANKIYVANEGSNNVTVIDGATNTTTTVGVGTEPSGVAVNPVTSRIDAISRQSVLLREIDAMPLRAMAIKIQGGRPPSARQRARMPDCFAPR